MRHRRRRQRRVGSRRRRPSRHSRRSRPHRSPVPPNPNQSTPPRSTPGRLELAALERERSTRARREDPKSRRTPVAPPNGGHRRPRPEPSPPRPMQTARDHRRSPRVFTLGIEPESGNAKVTPRKRRHPRQLKLVGDRGNLSRSPWRQGGYGRPREPLRRGAAARGRRQ